MASPSASVLKKGIRFSDDPCFPGGKGRELTSRDVFYSWKRMADDDNQPQSWWLLEGTIRGFDDYRKAQNAAESFDYDAPVEGMRVLSDHEFEVALAHPSSVFLYILAMFQTAVVPREAAEMYGTRFSRHPVGTGPFLLAQEEDWVAGKSIVLTKSPSFREESWGGSGGEPRRIPFLDRIEITFFVEDQPRWLEFQAGNLDYVTVPADNFTEAFNKRSRKLRRDYAGRGIQDHAVPLLDLIFRAFNMDDPLLGGYDEKKKSLRRAIHLAIDLEEFNDAFYNRICIVYDGPIPPTLDGHPENHLLGKPRSNQGPDLDRAREEMAKAGYPGGEGLPALEFWTSQGGNSKEQTELLQRQLARIGVKLNVRLVDFSQLSEATHKKKAPFFSFAWGSDYPDAENNLAIFYGPNESPGANFSNYKNPAYDRLYEQIRKMQPSPERTVLMEKMRDILLEDVPYIGSMARTRYYLSHPWMRNFHPTETYWTWMRYLDVER
ncbi:MAG: hypothetical protein HC813_00705 [Planctomycetes bacterium]|nr:hypothetical protein [Planctomycetota bacterium]